MKETKSSRVYGNREAVSDRLGFSVRTLEKFQRLWPVIGIQRNGRWCITDDMVSPLTLYWAEQSTLFMNSHPEAYSRRVPKAPVLMSDLMRTYRGDPPMRPPEPPEIASISGRWKT